MVDFVRPNFLGNKTEFSNMFERPIQNGQCIDSTPKDVRLMKHRAHVLHEQLKGFVQRYFIDFQKLSLVTKNHFYQTGPYCAATVTSSQDRACALCKDDRYSEEAL